MNPLSCLDNQENIGVSKCTKFPQQIKGMISTPENFSLTEEEANNVTNWQGALLAEKKNRIYLWPNAFNIEVVSEDAIYEETSLADANVRPGRYRFRMMFRENLQLHKAMISHRGFQGRVFLIDNENKIIGTTLSDGSFAGFELSLLNPEKIMFNDGSVVSKTPVYVSLYDSLELDQDGAMIDGKFVRQLIPLTSAKLEVQGTPSATEIVVDVKSDLDNEPLLGLVVGDFELLDASGTAQTIDSISESTTVEGRYTLTGTGLVSGTLGLVDPSSLSIVGFEGIPVEITIA